MRTGLLLVIGLILLGTGYWWYTQKEAGEEMDMEEAEEMMMDDEGEMEETMATSTDEGVMEETAATSSVQTFTVTGENFSFSEQQIRVSKGDTVRINFEATEGFHDWVIDEFNAATDQVRPGTLTSVEFVADKVGTFEYYCSVGNHREQGMVGQLIVEE